VAGTALGSQRFVARLKRVQGGDRAEQMSSRQLGVLTPLESVVRAVERVRGAPLREFLSRHGDPSRDVLWYLTRRRCGLTLRVLGERMGACVTPQSARPCAASSAVSPPTVPWQPLFKR
jgi:hypothetical protein